MSQLVEHLVSSTDEIIQKTGFKVVARPKGLNYILRDERVSLNVFWQQRISNSLTEEAGVFAVEYNGPIFRLDEGMRTVFPPRVLWTTSFRPTLSWLREINWIEERGKPEPLSTEAFADRTIKIFLSLIDRANKGDIDFNPT